MVPKLKVPEKLLVLSSGLLEKVPSRFWVGKLVNSNPPRRKILEDKDFTIYGEFRFNTVELHMMLKKWNFGTYKKLLDVAHILKQQLPNYGIEWMVVVLRVWDIKTRKFESMLGFEPYAESDTHVLMKQRCYVKWEQVLRSPLSQRSLPVQRRPL
jgi:hypothetical protein